MMKISNLPHFDMSFQPKIKFITNISDCDAIHKVFKMLGSFRNQIGKIKRNIVICTMRFSFADLS